MPGMTPAAAARASVAAARSSASSAQPLLRCPAAGAAHHARRRARAAASAPALALASWTRGWAQLRAYSTNNDDAAAPRAGYSAGASPGDSSSTGTSTSEERTPLTPLIEEVIRTAGPLSVARYMQLCATHPQHGYYAHRPVFGKQGDFITSPEISQVFGELLAVWYAYQWMVQGSAPRARIVELGPGRGTLMSDILRTFKALPKGAAPAIESVHLVENSSALRETQRKALEPYTSGAATALRAEWHDEVSQVPKDEDVFTIVVAHEFLDALPIHIFERTNSGWREVLVDVQPDSAVSTRANEPAFRLVLAPAATPATSIYVDMSMGPALSGRDETVALRHARLPVGTRTEISPASWEAGAAMGKLLEHKGAGLVVDYGDARAFSQSWRGFRGHQLVDPLSRPGHTDLTANVDFSALATSMARSATSLGPVTQRDFLQAMGLQTRLRKLLDAAPSDRRQLIESGANRLVDITGMGVQYRVQGIVPKAITEGYPFK